MLSLFYLMFYLFALAYKYNISFTYSSADSMAVYTLQLNTIVSPLLSSSSSIVHTDFGCLTSAFCNQINRIYIKQNQTQ